MSFKLSTYRNNINFIKLVVDRDKNFKSLSKIVSDISAATHTPAIVVAHFVGEVSGYTEEINELIESLTQFYNYDKIEE